MRKSVHPDKAERDRFFQSLLQEENREHETWVDQAIALLNHPLRQEEALKFIRPGPDELQKFKKPATFSSRNRGSTTYSKVITAKKLLQSSGNS